MYAAAFIRFFFSLEKSKVNETQVSNFPISLTDIERDHQTESRTKCIWKGHARHVLLCGDVFSVVFRSLFFQLLFLFHSIRFSTEHTVSHTLPIIMNGKNSLRPILPRKEKSKTISCSHTKNCCLLARFVSRFHMFNELNEEEKKLYYMWPSIKLSTLLLCCGMECGEWALLCINMSTMFLFFLSFFRAFNYCVCVCHLSCIWIFFPSFFPSSIVLVVFC